MVISALAFSLVVTRSPGAPKRPPNHLKISSESYCSHSTYSKNFLDNISAAKWFSMKCDQLPAINVSIGTITKFQRRPQCTPSIWLFQNSLCRRQWSYCQTAFKYIHFYYPSKNISAKNHCRKFLDIDKPCIHSVMMTKTLIKACFLRKDSLLPDLLNFLGFSNFAFTFNFATSHNLWRDRRLHPPRQLSVDDGLLGNNPVSRVDALSNGMVDGWWFLRMVLKSW